MKTTSSNPNRKQLIEKIISVATECHSYNPESTIPAASEFRYKSEASLEVILKDAERSLKNAKRIAKTNEFYATDGGQMFKAAQEKKLEEIKAQLVKNTEDFSAALTAMIEKVIGEGFKICVDHSMTRVFVGESNYTSFEIRYSSDRFGDEVSQVGYSMASYGTQEIASDVTTAYIAFGKLLEHAKKELHFERYIKGYCEYRSELRGSLYATKRLIENPLSL